MRAFRTILTFLLAFVTLAFADDAQQYDATVVITSTVYKVNTIYQSGSPTGSVANMTSTFGATATGAPLATSVKPAQPSFTGAAGALSANALAALMVAGGLLAL